MQSLNSICIQLPELEVVLSKINKCFANLVTNTTSVETFYTIKVKINTTIMPGSSLYSTKHFVDH